MRLKNFLDNKDTQPNTTEHSILLRGVSGPSGDHEPI